MNADAPTELASTWYRSFMIRVEARRFVRLFLLFWVAGGVYVVRGGGDDMPGRENVLEGWEARGLLECCSKG